MEINIPLNIEIDKDIFLNETNLQNKQPVDVLKNIAYGDLPELNEFIHNFIKKNEDEIAQLIRYNIALEVGKNFIDK